MSSYSLAAWSATPPYTAPSRNSDTPHQNSVARWRRTARPIELPSHRDAAAGPGRSASTPAPTSRRALIADRADDKCGRGGRGEEQRPPPLVDVRPRLARPSERREPRESTASHVADGPHEVRAAHRDRGDPQGRAGAHGQLGHDQGNSREDEADTREGAGEGERSGCRQAVQARREADRQQGGEDQVGAADDRQRRHGCGMAPDGGRPDQVLAPALFLGACVPHDEEDAHQGDSDRCEREQLVGRHRAEGVVVTSVAGADEQLSDGVVEHPGARLAVGRGGIRLGEAGDGPHDRERDRQDPHRDAHPVASQHRTDQGTGAGQRARRAHCCSTSSSPLAASSSP